mgnify:FL=1
MIANKINCLSFKSMKDNSLYAESRKTNERQCLISERQFYPSTKNSVAVEDIQKKQAHHSPVI